MRETDNTDVPGKRARWRVQSHPETPQSTGSARHWRRCSRNPCSAREIRSYIRILPGSASALQGTLLPCERGAVFPALRSMGCRGFPLCGRGAARAQNGAPPDVQVPTPPGILQQAGNPTLSMDGLQQARDDMEERAVVDLPEVGCGHAAPPGPPPHFSQSHHATRRRACPALFLAR